MNLSFAAWHNNEMVGFLLTDIDETNLNSPYIHNIAVRHEYQGKRLGKKLVDLMIEKCNENRTDFHFDNVILHCEVTYQRAISVYKQSGFILVKRYNNFYGRGRHAQLMSKPLEN